jgi:biopolymer transport protein ExbB/TolQ
MFQTGPLGVILSLGIVSKVVLVLLVCFSITSWAIIFYKLAVFRTADAKDRHFMTQRCGGSHSACATDGWESLRKDFSFCDSADRLHPHRGE